MILVSVLARSFQLSNTFNIKKCLAHDTSTTDINAIDSHEGIGYGLTAICEQGIGKTIGYDFNRHTRLDTDAIKLTHSLGGNTKSRHSG